MKNLIRLAGLFFSATLLAACSNPLPASSATPATTFTLEVLPTEALSEQGALQSQATATALPECPMGDELAPARLAQERETTAQAMARLLADSQASTPELAALRNRLGTTVIDIQNDDGRLVALVALYVPDCSHYSHAPQVYQIYVISSTVEAWPVGYWGHPPQPDDIHWVDHRWLLVVEQYGSPSMLRSYAIWHVAETETGWATVFDFVPEQDVFTGTRPEVQSTGSDSSPTLADYRLVLRFTRMQANTIPCASNDPLPGGYYRNDQQVETVYTWLGDRYQVAETLLSEKVSTWLGDDSPATMAGYGFRRWEYYCLSATQPVFSGKIAYAAGQADNSDIYVMNATGSERTRLTTDPAADRDPAWSPDGTRLAFISERDGNPEIYVMAADGGQLTRLTQTSQAGESSPSWSPDGTRLAFSRQSGLDQHIWVMNVDGSSPIQLTTDKAWNWQPAWSPDGRRIAFVSGRHGNGEIYVMTANGTNQTRLTNDPAFDLSPVWSPDGQRIAFVSNRDGDDEIYVMNADGDNLTRLTDSPGGDDYSPTWSPDGERILFLSGHNLAEIGIIDPAGNNRTRVLTIPGNVLQLAWQPGARP